MHLADSRPGAELQDGHVGEGVIERVHRVAEPALLADLLEQARAHRAAEQRGVDRQRSALAQVRDRDVGAVDHAQVRLVGVALLDQLLRRELRRRHIGLWLGQRGKAREALLQLGLGGQVLEVAARKAPPRDPAQRRSRKATIALTGEAAQVLLGPEHGAPQRMLAEGGPVDQVLGDHRGLVVGAVDLLDHHPALAVELLGVQARAPHEVAEQVDRRGRALGANRDVEGHQVVARVGVEHAAEALGGLVDVLVGAGTSRRP